MYKWVGYYIYIYIYIYRERERERDNWVGYYTIYICGWGIIKYIYNWVGYYIICITHNTPAWGGIDPGGKH